MRLAGVALPRERSELRSRSTVIFCSKAIGFSVLIALSARLQFPVPGTVVPATLQSFAVLVSGGVLGSWGGLLAVFTYLSAGLTGAPIFALGGGPAYLLGPTGGYLIGFLPTAWLAGYFRGRCRGVWSLFGGFVLATLVLHLAGWLQLSAIVGLRDGFRMGFLTFLPWDILKSLVAAAVVTGLYRRTPAVGGRKEQRLP